MTLPPFVCNVAYSIAVNDGLAADDPSRLSHADLWEGVRRGCTHPHEFAPYVANCEVTSGDTENFTRKLTLADGAIHTASGETLEQKVVVVEGLLLEGTTLNTGAKSTWMVSRNACKGANEDTDLLMIAAYELKMPNVSPESEEARKITQDYTALALNACRDGVQTIKGWKRAGRLEKMRLEREAGRVYQGP